VRGLSPYPAAWTELAEGDKRTPLKIFETAKEPAACPAEPMGTVLIDNARGEMRVALADGYLRVLSLQIAGKKRMATADFLRGLRADGPLQCL